MINDSILFIVQTHFFIYLQLFDIMKFYQLNLAALYLQGAYLLRQNAQLLQKGNWYSAERQAKLEGSRKARNGQIPY